MLNRRTEARRPTRWLGRWSRNGTTWWHCRVDDVSLGGAALSVKSSFQAVAPTVGTLVHVELVLAGGASALRLRAEIRNIDGFRVGVQWNALTALETKLLGTLLESATVTA